MKKIIKKQQNINIRMPKKDEFLKMCRVLNRADKPYQKFIPDYEPFTVKDLEYMKNKSKKSFLVIEIAKKIAGIAVWSIKNNQICWISLFHIDPQKQNMGLGTKLLKAIEQKAKKKNCSLVMGEMFPQAKWAKDFYLWNGYEILSKEDYQKQIFKNILSLQAKTLIIIKEIKEIK